MTRVVIILFYIMLFMGVIAAITIYLSPQDELVKADAIVAVSGGNTTQRVEHAVELYKKGLAPTLIFSGAALDPLSPSNAEVMRQTALDAGVPKSSIVVEEQAQNTAENALEASEIVFQFDYESIILVTSPYHQRRAYLEFSNRLGPQYKIINRPAPDSDWSRTSWFFTPEGWYLTTSEVIKTPIAYLRNLF